eukprot:TRINITY_DN80631_c0_g1_i1.p1 TRINITY_DN80631_c0_g1~~TRINITY_DN80631_c0_g1_i1.p1  ORF type:complete len:560 (+),score=117.45 TRINITY_DN80631_c0_g1_i1:86-1765(+)
MLASLATVAGSRLVPSLCRRAASAHLSAAQAKLQESYLRRVEAGQLESDQVQKRVVDFLTAALEQASARSAAVSAEAQAKQLEEVPAPSDAEKTKEENEIEEEVGWAGRKNWVLPRQTLGSSQQSVAEDHRRVAEYTARLAAENARRVRSQVSGASGSRSPAGPSPGAKVLPAAAPPAAATPAPHAAKAGKATSKRSATRTSVYLHGTVGTGKTMLMDLFYEHAREAGLRTLRKHFYEFMLGLHRQIHQIREDRPVEVAANSLADDIDVLCFDEFQITDIQDASILPRLFEVLFLRGVTVVMTSNTSPQLLYAGGLNRHVHLPAFIGLLAEHCTVLGLGGPGGRPPVDYRRKAEAAELQASTSRDGVLGADAFLFGADAEERLLARWAELTAGSEVSEPTLQLPMGRTLRIPKAAGSTCLVDFQDLCGSDRGEADFYALAESFRTVLLNGVPRFSALEDADAVRRFVKLLDLLYDRRVRLVVAAAVAPGELFQGVRDEVGKGDMSDLAWRTALYSADGKVGLSPQAVGTLCEAVRATERAESRLREMRTRRYWQSCGEK